MLGHKLSLNRFFKKIRFHTTYLLQPDGIKLEITNRRKMENSQICEKQHEPPMDQMNREGN